MDCENDVLHNKTIWQYKLWRSTKFNSFSNSLLLTHTHSDIDPPSPYKYSGIDLSAHPYIYIISDPFTYIVSNSLVHTLPLNHCGKAITTMRIRVGKRAIPHCTCIGRYEGHYYCSCMGEHRRVQITLYLYGWVGGWLFSWF